MSKNQTHIEPTSQNGHAPVPARKAEDIPIEEQQAILQAHRDRNVAIQEEADKGRVDTFLNLFGTPLSGVPTPVKCSVPGFEQLTAHFITSRANRKRREYPTLEVQREGETNEGYYERYDTWAVAMSEWIPLFIARIDGWDFRDTQDSPIPNPVDDHRVYAALFDYNEPLAIWFAFSGYTEALNFLSKTSEQG